MRDAREKYFIQNGREIKWKKYGEPQLTPLVASIAAERPNLPQFHLQGEEADEDERRLRYHRHPHQRLPEGDGAVE